MRILIVSNMYPSKVKPYAGIFVKNQYEELKKILDRNDILEIYYMERQFTSRLGSVIKYIKAFIRFLPILFKKYDVLHLHFFYPLIYFAWLYKKIHPRCKLLVTFHGIDITQKVNVKNKKHLQKVSKAIDFTIPVGITLADMVKKKLNLKVGTILPVGVNNNIFYKEVNVEKVYDFIFIGSFIKRKGIDTVIESIKRLDDKTISFCFCGSGEYGKQLEALKVNYNITIKQNQTQDELRSLLNQSHFFLLMSRSEGFPTATIEAMYCGIPVITSDISQFKEQVKHGYNGYMTPLEDYLKLSKKLIELKHINEEKYACLSENAKNSFKNLSLQNVCQELISIYKNL